MAYEEELMECEIFREVNARRSLIWGRE